MVKTKDKCIKINGEVMVFDRSLIRKAWSPTLSGLIRLCQENFSGIVFESNNKV